MSFSYQLEVFRSYGIDYGLQLSGHIVIESQLLGHSVYVTVIRS